MVLEELYTYPIKSTHRITHIQAWVEPWGLDGDRRWMAVNYDGKFMTQREFPRLSLIQAVPIQQSQLLLVAPDSPHVIVHTPDESAPMVNVRIWGDSVVARLASEMVNSWLSTFLDHQTRLVYMHDTQSRFADSEYTQSGTTVSFSDGYPLLCTSKVSLQELNKKMREPLPMGRFRPNVVVTGDQPFGEDMWKRIQIGEITFSVVKSCHRCVITTVDQDTAMQGKEPLRTLSRFRKRDGSVYFGENLVPENSGLIRRGDPVKVIEFRSKNDLR